MDDSTLDGTLNFFAAFPSETQMTIAVTDDDVSLETGSLTSLSLFLNWLNFTDFFFDLVL